jgi:hypothetical protein
MDYSCAIIIFADLLLLPLQKVWKSSDISLRTKLTIFNSNMKSILLYGRQA